MSKNLMVKQTKQGGETKYIPPRSRTKKVKNDNYASKDQSQPVLLVSPNPHRSSSSAKTDGFPAKPHVKRQICYTCGIAGHIARNCQHRPDKLKKGEHQEAPKGNLKPSKPGKDQKSKPIKKLNSKVKPSDDDWNRAKEIKLKNKSSIPTSKPVLPKASKKFEKSKQVWKPKSLIPDVSPKSSCTNDTSIYSKGNHIWMKVTYMNKQGVPTATMAWVPKTN